MPDFITPDWPAPPKVCAYSTTRTGGFSQGPYQSFNLGDHVGDSAYHVLQNRQLLIDSLQLPASPVWVTQVHSSKVVEATHLLTPIEADGAFSATPQVVCAVLTADCLPILICDRQGTKIAALHAGWRGLSKGIIENGFARLNISPDDLLVWLGPAISQSAYEVGPEVFQQFAALDESMIDAFKPTAQEKWWLDLYFIARQKFHALGVDAIYGGDFCTFTESERFFSYRRDVTTGRMASLIWLRNS